jgi:hypothetical protein
MMQKLAQKARLTHHSSMEPAALLACINPPLLPLVSEVLLLVIDADAVSCIFGGRSLQNDAIADI